jgi:hypothetical protein
MLVPRPPRLPPARRAVPEIVVRYEQPAPISVGHVLRAKVDEREITSRLGEADPAIHFTVIYELREYLRLLGEHLPADIHAWERARTKAPRDQLSWSGRVALAVLVPLMGTPIFLLKKRRMPICRFTIDVGGIERRTNDGSLFAAWTDVVAVHRYSQAYLIDKGHGGMPIPYRCLTVAERAQFERFLLSRFGG